MGVISSFVTMCYRGLILHIGETDSSSANTVAPGVIETIKVPEGPKVRKPTHARAAAAAPASSPAFAQVEGADGKKDRSASSVLPTLNSFSAGPVSCIAVSEANHRCQSGCITV